VPAVSWQVSSDEHPSTEIREAIDAMEPGAELSEGQLAQLRDAKEAAKGALDQGVAGAAPREVDDGDEVPWFKTTISGHAEGDSAKGEPGDFVEVRVEQVAAPS
jgi:hypothetical protein